MIIKKYGIELHRLTHADIELVRQMRNKDSVREKMFFQGNITPEMQEEWFQSIDNRYNYYFLIINKGQKIGLINGKNIDFEKRITECGIFIWEEKYWNSGVAFQAAMCIIEFGFEFFSMKKLFSKVKEDNPIAVKFNQGLGYRKCTPYNGNNYVLTKEEYYSKAYHIRDLIIKRNGGTDRLTIHDFTFTNFQQTLHLYQGLPKDIKEKFKDKIAV